MSQSSFKLNRSNLISRAQNGLAVGCWFKKIGYLVGASSKMVGHLFSWLKKLNSEKVFTGRDLFNIHGATKHFTEG